MSSKRIKVTGVVQGVGFRPFVYQMAKKHGLSGWVCNTSSGVEIEVEGEDIEEFLHDLRSASPPLARIISISVGDVQPQGFTDFHIGTSQKEEGEYLLISPDIAACTDCLEEVFASENRRYRYPFTNCTNCGPRFTIIEDIPYDRPKTTMKVFPMCPACQSEYDDPTDRRFHAQPNACPTCGPQLSLLDAEGNQSHAKDCITTTSQLLRQGKIVAIKGLGGFHLACDATSDKAVAQLRQRKGRPHKPLAVMMTSLDQVRKHCHLSPEEEKLLVSPQTPIVLLLRRDESNVSEGVAPGNNYLGVMLPYTPLHHLLLKETGIPLVMTSGNRGDEAIAKENGEALARLSALADAFLLHNREIKMRCDDSVLVVEDGHPSPLRRSRGYAPYPIHLPFKTREVLACGPELKNTFCFTKDDYAFLSQHIGDLQNMETLEHFTSSLEHYKRLFHFQPRVIAHDMHPDYLATRYAQELGKGGDNVLVPVQHHHAHIASCLADNRLCEQVIGVALDGTGFGVDGHVWGGEFMVADLRDFKRLGHLEYLPMPGGEAAILKPYRLAIGYLYTLLGEIPGTASLRETPPAELEAIKKQIDRGFNAPLTSSCGRLFDAVAAILGIREVVTYEAQAAVELEMLSAKASQDAKLYPFTVEKEEPHIVNLRELLLAILEDSKTTAVPTIGLRFHRTVAAIIVEVCRRISKETGLKAVALSGGVFQNRLLVGLTKERLGEAGFTVYTHHQVPTNDGGISLGQAVIAHFRS